MFEPVNAWPFLQQEDWQELFFGNEWTGTLSRAPAAKALLNGARPAGALGTSIPVQA